MSLKMVEAGGVSSSRKHSKFIHKKVVKELLMNVLHKEPNKTVGEPDKAPHTPTNITHTLSSVGGKG